MSSCLRHLDFFSHSGYHCSDVPSPALKLKGKSEHFLQYSEGRNWGKRLQKAYVNKTHFLVLKCRFPPVVLAMQFSLTLCKPVHSSLCFTV